MRGLIEGAAWVVVALAAAASLLGAAAWWQVRPSRPFWVLARAAQAAAVGLAALAGVALLGGAEPADGLFWVYAFVPAVVGVVAEQLRIASAETVLDARGLESAQAVGGLPEAAQRSVALAVVRREIGVTAVAVAVAGFLALRALGTVAGLE